MNSLTFKLVAKLSTIAIFAVTAFAVVIPSGPAVAVSSAVSSESLSQASIYRAHCARCHGNDGHANTKEGRKTEAADLTEESVKTMSTEKMTRIIRNGKSEMPGFAKKLSAAQIAALIRYVRGL